MKYHSIPREWKREAKEKAKRLGNLNGSITKGKGNLTGMIGEVAISRLHKWWKWSPTRDYDFLLPDGRTVDVKSKSTRFKPKEHFECSIASWNTRQQCDIYLFTRIQYERDDVHRHQRPVGIWILGYMEKEEYFSRACFIKKGTHDPSNRWTCPHSCYNLKISDLKPISDLC